MTAMIKTFTMVCLACALPATGLGVAQSDETAVLPSKAEIRAMHGAPPTIQWAVERVAKELAAVYKINATQNLEARTPFDDSQRDRAQVFLGVWGRSSVLGQWCREQGISGVSRKAGSNAYRVTVLRDPLRVVIVGSDDVGAWYGACAWLDSLKSESAAIVRTPMGEMSGVPALEIRMGRNFDLSPDQEVDSVNSQIPFLDWYARWRLNFLQYGDVPDARLAAEAHKRGIKTILSLNARSVCASDEKSLADMAAQFERFLKDGGDGAAGTWDDVFGERIQGHCERCREKFGPNGITQEIIIILERLVDVAAKYPGKKYIIWCPPHYTRNRYQELSDEEFFGKVSASEKVRTVTYMWHTQCGDEPTSFLDRYGMTRRVWWYNGMYPLAEAVARRRPEPVKSRIKQQLCNKDFARFDAVGFIEDVIKTNDVREIYPPGDAKWKALRLVSERFQGAFGSSDWRSSSYYTGQSGLYAWSPKRFDQDEADRRLFRALFGIGSQGPARRWSDLENEIEVRLANKLLEGGSLSDSEQREVAQQMERWHSERVAVEAIVARGRSLAEQRLLEPVLRDMRKAEETVAGVVRDLSTTDGTANKAGGG